MQKLLSFSWENEMDAPIRIRFQKVTQHLTI